MATQRQPLQQVLPSGILRDNDPKNWAHKDFRIIGVYQNKVGNVYTSVICPRDALPMHGAGGAAGRWRGVPTRVAAPRLEGASTACFCASVSSHGAAPLPLAPDLTQGGTGKTATAYSLATALAASGARALLVDLDPQ